MLRYVFFFFFKQKTAYEMRISDWSSDVCSSDLHEIMMRGTFANIRIKNETAPGTEGGVTKYAPTGEVMPIYDAAMRYMQDGVPLIAIAGKEYGTGSSRDWAAKGTKLLGIRAVIRSEERRVGEEGVSRCISRWWPDQ